jgi:hypothetical protein
MLCNVSLHARWETRGPLSSNTYKRALRYVWQAVNYIGQMQSLCSSSLARMLHCLVAQSATFSLLQAAKVGMNANEDGNEDGIEEPTRLT